MTVDTNPYLKSFIQYASKSCFWCFPGQAYICSGTDWITLYPVIHFNFCSFFMLCALFYHSVLSATPIFLPCCNFGTYFFPLRLTMEWPQGQRFINHSKKRRNFFQLFSTCPKFTLTVSDLISPYVVLVSCFCPVLFKLLIMK